MSDTLQTLGILGSGQLGRMIAIAAAQLGIRAVIFAPDAIRSPAADVAHAIITASYDDKAALDAFALQVDAVCVRGDAKERRAQPASHDGSAEGAGHS